MNFLENQKLNFTLLAFALLIGFPSQASSGDSWAQSMSKVTNATERWELTCEMRHCNDTGTTPDPVNAAYEKAIIDILGAWAEGESKRQAGLVPNELRPKTDQQLVDVLNKMSGRWIGTTSWGTQIGQGEIEGVVVDFKIEKRAGRYEQNSTHAKLNCSSIGNYAHVRRGSIRFNNKTQTGDCRDQEIGVRLFDNGTIKWTRFVGDWPQAWAILRPIQP